MDLRIEREGASLWLRFDRASRRNALTAAMLRAAAEAIEAASRGTEARAIVLAGEGDVFSAGLDLEEMVSSAAAARALFDQLNRLCLAIRRAPQPVVASVAGECVAGALQLAATCDLVVAAESASFRAPGATLGLLAATPAVALTRALAPRHAMEFLLLAEPVSAARAHTMGLVNVLAADAHLGAETRRVVERLLSHPGLTDDGGKRAILDQMGRPEDEVYADLVDWMIGRLADGPTRAAIDAFLARRNRS